MSDEREAKMVIVVIKDIFKKIRGGKAVAQGGHCGATFMIERCRRFMDKPLWTPAEKKWMFTDQQTKIVLGAKDEAEMLEVMRLFEEAKIQVFLITDAGKTEFKGPTNTCIAVGPDWNDEIDKITGPLGIHPLKPY
jgi:PTH2 family peptidyl-tRNA hydrolase